MGYEPVGGQWLLEHFKLFAYTLTRRSFIGGRALEPRNGENDTVEAYYQRRMAPAKTTPLAHLEFFLKHEDLNLDFLKAVFEKIPEEDILRYIQEFPSSRYGRRMGYLYEFLLRKELPLTVEITGSYANILEEEKYITGKRIRSTKWHVTDNLLGTLDFCPIIRKTGMLAEALRPDLRSKIEELSEQYPAGTFQRAISYLYTRETRSSFEIENEKPGPGRLNRFITLLANAGRAPSSLLLSERHLAQLQNDIVDPRFAAAGFRDFQNYIGEMLPDYGQRIHYVCPPPHMVASLMKGLQEMAQKAGEAPPVVQAALVAFGFVFIHPFEDGNGRLHRFLIHEILTREGVVPDRSIVPVSAHMLRLRPEYDRVLEAYSGPLLDRVRYDLSPSATLEITNKSAVEAYYRYPDLTGQCLYLARTLYATITEDMAEELKFLYRYDEVKRALQEIVDMPDRLLDRMILYLHQNRGVLAKRRRIEFSVLADEEIERMQAVFQEVFEIKA